MNDLLDWLCAYYAYPQWFIQIVDLHVSLLDYLLPRVGARNAPPGHYRKPWQFSRLLRAFESRRYNPCRRGTSRSGAAGLNEAR